MQVANTVVTGDPRIDALLGARQWASSGGQAVELTYSFPGATSVWSSAAGEYGAGDAWGPQSGFAPLSELEKSAVRAALDVWAAVANIHFVETVDNATGSGTLRFAWTESSVAEQSFTYAPGSSAKAGDVWLNALAPWDGFEPGSYGFATLIHEIGHALGLKHPFEGAVVLPLDEESYAVSLMSYTAYTGSTGSWVDFEPTTPMLYDIPAIQWLYGANWINRDGDDTYVFTEGQRYFETLWDTGGNDTIVWQAEFQGTLIDLSDGYFSEIGDPLTYWAEDFSSSWSDGLTVAIATGVAIENATGGNGSDLLIGNGLDNWLTGNADDDGFYGGAGNDRFDGGAGSDMAIWLNGSDHFTLSFEGNAIFVEDNTLADGTDRLTGMEELRFSDKTVIVESRAHNSYADIPVELYHFFIVAFNAAPGVEYMDQLAEAWHYGLSVKQIVDIFTTKHQFTDVYPTTLSHQALANELVTQIVKSSASDAAKQEAKGDIQAALDFGLTVGGVIYNVFGNLAHKPLSDPTWGNTARQFDNEIEVARYYTEVLNQSTTDLDTLRDVLAPVNAWTDVSTDAVIATLIGVALLDG